MKPHPGSGSPQRGPATGSTSADKTPVIPPARRTRHVGALLWWGLAALAFVFTLQGQPGQESVRFSPPQVPRTEHDAFIAFVFGKVEAGGTETIDPQALRAQLENLKASGAHPIRLDDVRAFLEKQEPLPDKPVLLVFDEARRATIDAVDPILAELGFQAVTFVTVDDVEGGNVDLVSRRRLRKMVHSGRWEVGISACHLSATVESGDTPRVSGATYRRWREKLQDWSGGPVQAASCLRGWHDIRDGRARWDVALRGASLPLGFVARAPGTNHHGDHALGLRLIRISARDRQADTLVQHAAAYVPRRERYADDFNGNTLANAWVADREQVHAENGVLRLTARANDWGGGATLGGTERWRDVKVAVVLDRPPTGQFWIYARRSSPAAFVRLGINGRRALLQRSDVDGTIRQLAAHEVGTGPMRLELSVIGSRAVATVDGVPILDRPADLPADVAEGPVSLVAWSGVGNASALLRWVEAKPVPRRFVMLRAQPDPGDFAKLRAQADALWAVSPQLFRWHAGSATRSATLDPALEMFVHHHRMTLLPAVAVDELPAGAAWGRFREHLLQWAGDPDYAGLNVVIERLNPEDIGQVEALRQEMGRRGKELVVTARHAAQDFPPAQHGDWLASLEPGTAAFGFATVNPQRPS